MINSRSNVAPPGTRRAFARDKGNRLTALAASVSFAAIASPAYAQCVEGPPNSFACSGTTNVPQIIVGDDASITAAPNFEVDTTDNGNGLALQVTGDGLISFTGSPMLKGAGVRFSTTGASGSSPGALDIASAGTIIADGANGLRLDNNGGGDTIATWVGSITNSGGNGLFARNFPASGQLSLLVRDVAGRDDGIRIEHGGAGAATVTAFGSVMGSTAAGVRVGTVGAAGSIDLTLADVSGGTFGVLVDNSGVGLTRIEATGAVVGQSEDGIRAINGASALGIDIRAAEVSGSISGIHADNQGGGSIAILATGPVAAGGNGILSVNGTAAQDIAITAADVSGFYGIRAFNGGTGTTSITATGLVEGTDYGIVAENAGGSTDLNIGAADVIANGIGMEIENSGSGTTTVVVDTVTGLDDVGVRITTAASAGSVDLTIGDATGGEAGAVISHFGTGAARLTATGTVTGANDIGINVGNEAGGTDIEIHANNVNAGSYFGILGSNEGTGDTLIETTGMVAVDGIYGIIGLNEATARNMTVSAVDVVAGRGLSISNFGTGTTDVVATGTVTGYGSEGVVVGVEGTATDVRVDVNVVNGEGRGMRIVNSGIGMTSIRARGTVTGATSSGIEAEIDATAKDVAIDVVDVTGVSGIRVDNQGLGTTRVTATGTVTGTSGDGINVFAFTQADDIEIDVADVIGGTSGVNVTNFGSGATSITASGAISALAPDGYGIVVQTGTGSTDIRIATADVLGNAGGLYAENLGSGGTVITSTGTITGGFDFGLFARNAPGAPDLTVSANNVVGATTGMQVVNDGFGTTSINATGIISGTSGAGIDARTGVNALGLTLSAVDVSGASGITVQNFGEGSAGVSATGVVTALEPTGTGIAVVGGTSSTDLTVAAARVAGGSYGIDTFNAGGGDTLIVASALVIGSEVAIRARNGVGTGGLGIRSADIQSTGSGIVAENLGTGRTIVRAEGTVAAQGETGIAVSTGTLANDVVVTAGAVTGAFGGIWVDNQGIGSTSIAASGPVSGDDFGIIAQNGTGTTDLAIVARDVQGGGNAILAENLGTGETRVTTTGFIAGGSQSGIVAFAGTTAGDITIEAGNVSGGVTGISAINFGFGNTSVTINGTVHGLTAGVEAFADGNQNAVIVNSGTVRNSSGALSDRAISASGGGVAIGNSGTLIGTVAIAGDQSLMVNSGTWSSVGGVSIFATLNDTLLNNPNGTLVGGARAVAAETTIWQGLERFTNQGTLRLQDGGTGDRIQTSAATSFASGSLLAVDVAGANGADLYSTTGTVQIDPGSRLQVGATQPLALYGKYVVVRADGGLTGAFAFDDQLLTAFAGLRDGYTATTAFVEFAQLKPFAGAGLTANQKETGAGADSLPDGNPLKDALLLLPDDASAQDAFDQLSGEIHPSTRGVMFDDSRLVRNAVLDRLSDDVPGWSAWARGFGAGGQNDGDYNAARANRDTRGGIIGVDRTFDAVTFGIAGGWTDTDVKVQRRASNGSVNSAHALAYIGAGFGQVRLRGGLGYAWTTTETRRSIAFEGFAGQTDARYKGSVLQAYGEAGVRLPLSGGYVEPFLGVTHVRARTDAFTETGGLAALSGAAIDEDRTSSSLGLRLETAPAGAIFIRGSVGWSRTWGDLDPAGSHAFAGGTPFTVLGAAGSRDSALARFEAQMRLSSNVTLSIGYDGVLASGGDDHAVTGGLRIVF